MKIKELVKKVLCMNDCPQDAVEQDILFDLKGEYAEYLRSLQFLRRNDRELDKLFDELVRAIEGEFGGWALAASALRYLFYYIMQAKIPGQPYHILELGGGQSTMFWKGLSNRVPEISVITWEHDSAFAESLALRVRGTPVDVRLKRLMQYTDKDWEAIFAVTTLGELDIALQSASPKIVGEAEYSNWRIHNTFYEFDAACTEDFVIDALIVDGPHGNGRSMAYAVFARRMRIGTLILIDDVSHYSFLEHLSKFVEFTILQTSFSLTKQWALLQVESVMPS
jgi:hypothetical protein